MSETVEFHPGECQALLDLMEKLAPAVRREQWTYRYGLTDEENAALIKLRAAAAKPKLEARS
jgi:hypothetical protein